MGATSGIGRCVALGLLRQGWTIGVAGRRTEALESLKAVDPEHVFTRTIDVTCPDAPKHLRALIDEMGGMDLYFHSSGCGHQNTELEPAIEDRTLMTNAFGFTQMVGEAFRYFRDAHRPGRIAVITSDFHVFRAQMIARRAGLTTFGVPARTDWVLLNANYYVREFFALGKTLLFD